MAHKKLNVKILDALKPAAKRIEYFDADQPGLCLRVSPDGTKSFSVMYRHGGKLRRFTLGKYPAVGLASARTKAKSALEDVANGEDPMAQKAALRVAGTLGELADFYMDEHSKVNKKSWPEDRRMFDAYVLPVLKEAKASAVTIDDIEVLLEGVAKRGKVMADRVRALLRHLFTWALQTRKHRQQFLLTANPCAYVARFSEENARERIYSDEELKSLWRAFGKVGMVGDLFKLQLLTATRKGELVNMEWSEVDFAALTWTQPGEKTKNSKAHVVPLSDQCVRILKALRKSQAALKNEKKQESKFVFFSSRTGAVAMTWLQKAADRVKKESKIKDFRAHDLRRTAATRLAQAGLPDPVLKMVLNHSLGKDVTGIYNRYAYFEERKKALDAWASKVAVIASGLKAVPAKLKKAART